MNQFVCVLCCFYNILEEIYRPLQFNFPKQNIYSKF